MKDRPYYLNKKDAERFDTMTFGQMHSDFNIEAMILTSKLVKLCNRYNTSCEVYANGGYLSKWSNQAADMQRSEDGRRILSENCDKAEAERDSLPIKMQKLIDKEDADEHGQNRDRFHVVESGMYAYITFNGSRIPWQS